MRAPEQTPRAPGACAACLRRSWLLAVLGPRLEYRCRQEERLVELLAIEDRELLEAVGGRKREELKARYAQFDPNVLSWAEDMEAVCRHDPRYPRGLNRMDGPRMLNVAGGVDRLRELTTPPSVAIVGSRRATDYGMEIAKSLARGLAANGVTVTSGLADGIAVAAHAGALEADGRTVAVMSGGLDVACPAKWRSLYERVRRSGCAVAELPCGCGRRRWAEMASGRILAGFVGLTVVVEAEDSPGEVAAARMAQRLGKTVAAVPGRVTSPASSGTNALLMGGAHLVRGAGDVLELLHGLGVPTGTAIREATVELEPRLRGILERVGAGSDTPEKLTGDRMDASEVLLGLSELELKGLLARGDGGRYVPRDPLAC